MTTTYRLVFPTAPNMIRVANDNIIMNLRDYKKPSVVVPGIVQRAQLMRFSSRMMVITDSRNS